MYDSGTWESQDLLVGSVRRPRKTKKTKCTTCVCAICCALSICTLSCPHETKHFGSESSTPVKVADVEDVYKRQNLTVPQYRQWRQRVAEEHFVAHGYTGRMCAPKAGSYSQTVAAAVRTSELSDAQAARPSRRRRSFLTSRSRSGARMGRSSIRSPGLTQARTLMWYLRTWQLCSRRTRSLGRREAVHMSRYAVRAVCGQKVIFVCRSR